MLDVVGAVVVEAAVVDAVSCRAVSAIASMLSIARADVRVPAAQSQRQKESLIFAICASCLQEAGSCQPDPTTGYREYEIREIRNETTPTEDNHDTPLGVTSAPPFW